MKVYVAQVKPRVGDLKYNFEMIKRNYHKACEQRAEICFFPEMVAVGYTPEDLMFKSSFIKELESHTAGLIEKIKDCALVLPTITQEEGKLYNNVLVIQNRKIIGKTGKMHLPSYGTFDEKRYFLPKESQVITINGYKVGIPICEDMWFSDVALYLKGQGAQLLLVPNASPYDNKKFCARMEVLAKRYDETGLPIIYCNQVLGQDGIVFDGRSLGFDGELKFCLASFEEDDILAEIKDGKIQTSNVVKQFLPEDEMYGAMVLGLRGYIRNNNFKSVILGLSGGIDSALVAAIAVDGLGKDNVSAIMMPSQFTSKESLEDAEAIAKMLGINYQVISITNIVNSFGSELGRVEGIAYENLQSRARGIILMTISNMAGSLVLTTGNKSENATGYATLYGDMCGAFNPIKDLYKTEVFKVSKWRNLQFPTSIKVMNPKFPVMPKRVITKPPSAELRANQKDSDSLPEYSLLDAILNLYIEEDLSKEEIIAKGFSKDIVERVIKLVKTSEYKRRQSPPGVKLSTRNFEKDRRYPITNLYNG